VLYKFLHSVILWLSLDNNSDFSLVLRFSRYIFVFLIFILFFCQ